MLFYFIISFFVSLINIVYGYEQHTTYDSLFPNSIPINDNIKRHPLTTVLLTALQFENENDIRTHNQCREFCNSQTWCIGVDGCNFITDLQMLNMDGRIEKKLLDNNSIINLGGFTFVLALEGGLGNIEPDGTVNIINPLRINKLNDSIVSIKTTKHPEPLFISNVYSYYFGLKGPDVSTLQTHQFIFDADNISPFFKGFPIEGIRKFNTTKDNNQPFGTYFRADLIETTSCGLDIVNNIDTWTEIIDRGAYYDAKYFKIFTDENPNIPGGPLSSSKVYFECNEGSKCKYKSGQTNTMFAFLDYSLLPLNNGFFQNLIAYNVSNMVEIGFLGAVNCFTTANPGNDDSTPSLFLSNIELEVSYDEHNFCKYAEFKFMSRLRRATDSNIVKYDRMIKIISLCKKNVHYHYDASGDFVEPCISSISESVRHNKFSVFNDDLIRMNGLINNGGDDLNANLGYALSLVLEPVEVYDENAVREIKINVNGTILYAYCSLLTKCVFIPERKQLFVYESNGVNHSTKRVSYMHNLRTSRVAIYEKTVNKIWSKVGYLCLAPNEADVRKCDLDNPYYGWAYRLDEFTKVSIESTTIGGTFLIAFRDEGATEIILVMSSSVNFVNRFTDLNITSVNIPINNEKYNWIDFSPTDESIICPNGSYVTQIMALGDTLSIACLKSSSNCTIDDSRTFYEPHNCGSLPITGMGVMIGIMRNSTMVICRSLNIVSQIPKPDLSNLVPYVGKISHHNSSTDGSSKDSYEQFIIADFFIDSHGSPIQGAEYSENFAKVEHMHFKESPCIYSDIRTEIKTVNIESGIDDETSDCSSIENSYITHISCRKTDCRKGLTVLCVCADTCIVGSTLPGVYINTCPFGTVVTNIKCKTQTDACAEDTCNACESFELKCAFIERGNKDSCKKSSGTHDDLSTIHIGEIIGITLIVIISLVLFAIPCVFCCKNTTTEVQPTNSRVSIRYRF